MSLMVVRTGWYLTFGVVFGALSFMRTNAYKRRTGNSPWHIHPLVWGIASVFVFLFGTLLSIIACSTSSLQTRKLRGFAQPATAAQAAKATSAPLPANAFAAWLTDPTGRHEQRYFDGSGWTDHVANEGVTSVDPF